jgi:hypothetical protein
MDASDSNLLCHTFDAVDDVIVPACLDPCHRTAKGME